MIDNYNPAESSRKVRVLLVDDNELLLQAMVAVLSHMSVTACRGAEEALARLDEDSNYDAIISDIRMPGISGTEFYNFVFEKFPDLARAFILLTGNSEASAHLIAECRVSDEGGEPPMLLQKPAMQEDITRAIDIVMARRRTKASHDTGDDRVRGHA